jgi:hypothetical protein
MQYITFRLQTDCNQTFHPLSFSIKYALYFLYFITGNKDPRMLMRYTHLRAEDLVKRLG